MAELSNREKDLFLAALDMPTADERAAFVAGACGADEPLRKQVEAMLKAHDRADSFLEKPAAALEPVTELSPGVLEQAVGTHIGPYKLLQKIGEGGMGVVYMVQQQEPVSRYVALKIIKPGLDNAQVAARLEAERQALALMDHPNIARVFDAGATEDGRPYLVMELVKGTTITKFCDERRLTPRERLELFVPVCRAVQHAHQKGIIHRDLKPSNVLIALYDGKPVPKVIDFGIVKAIGQKLTQRTLFTHFGSILGTLEYMSPEQAEVNQMDVDTRSDIYSLGVMLYELLTGSTPLSRERLKSTALLQVLLMIREEEPPSPSVRISQSGSELASLSQQRQTEPARLSNLFRGDIDGIVMKSLDKDRNRRYETAAGLAQDIERYLADEPVQARPPSAMYRLSKFVRRNRGAVMAASLLLGALIAGVIGTTTGMLAAIEARDEANTNKQIADDLMNKAIQDAAEAVRLKNLADENAQAAKFQALRADTARHGNQMNTILRAWQRDDLHAATQVLDDVSAEYRGTLEYRFLRALCRRRARPMSISPNPGSSFTFSPNGKTMVQMGAYDPNNPKSHWSMEVADTVSGRSWTATGDVGRRAGNPAFDPTGRFFVVIDELAKKSEGRPVGTERRMTVWNAETGAKLRSVSCPSLGYPFTPNRLNEVALSPNAKLLALQRTGGFGVVNVANGSVLYEIEEPKGAVDRFVFSPDGKLLAGHLVGLKDEVGVYHAADGKEKLKLTHGGSYGPEILAFSPDSRNLLALFKGTSELGHAYPPVMRVWDVQTGKVRLQRQGQGYVRWDAGFLADSKSVVIVADPRVRFGDHQVTVVDMETGREKEAAQPLGPTTCFGRIDPEGRWVRERSLMKPRLEWSFAKTAMVPDKKLELVGAIENTQVQRFSPDSNEICLVVDYQLFYLDAITGKKLRTGARFSKDYARISRAMSADGKWIACFEGGKLRIFDAASGEMAFGVEPPRDHDLLDFGRHSADFSPDSARLAVIGTNSRIQIWNLASRKVELSLPSDGPVDALAFGPADQVAAVPREGSAEGVVVWHARTGKRLTATGDERLSKTEYEVEFLPDGKRLLTRTVAASGHVPVIKTWDIATGKKLSQLRFEGDAAWHTFRQMDGDLFPLLLSQDGSRLISGNRIWDVATGELVLILPDDMRVEALAPDGRRLVCRFYGAFHGLGIFEVP